MYNYNGICIICIYKNIVFTDFVPNAAPPYGIG